MYPLFCIAGSRFGKSTMVICVLAAPGSRAISAALQMSAAAMVIAGGTVSVVVGRGKYPDPPTGLPSSNSPGP